MVVEGDDFRSKLQRVRAYRLDELRPLMHQARAVVEAKADPDRSAAHTAYAGALNALSQLMRLRLSQNEEDEDGSLTVGEFLPDDKKREIEEQVNIAAQALVVIWKA